MHTKVYCEGVIRDRKSKIDRAIKKINYNFSQMAFENMQDKDTFEKTVIVKIIGDLNSFKDELDAINFE